MALALTQAHGTAQRRLREIVAQAVLAVWHGLGHYDEADVDPFLSTVLPIVNAGQEQSSALTTAYLARVLRVPHFGVDPALVTGAAVRNGTDPETVYRRPFIQVWQDLGDGKSFNDAVEAAGSRLDAVSQTDVALASRATYQAAQDDVDGIYGYERVPSATACAFCRKIAGAVCQVGDGVASPRSLRMYAPAAYSPASAGQVAAGRHARHR